MEIKHVLSRNETISSGTGQPSVFHFCTLLSVKEVSAHALLNLFELMFGFVKA